MSCRFTPFLLAAFLAGAISIASAQSLPNPSLTPGAINPSVTQQNISSTICERGWTATIRPPEPYTEKLKREQIAAYGYRDHRLRDYEEDHLVPLGLGGAPSDPRNLWPEPHLGPNEWGSYAKDRLEARLSELVCDGTLPLETARTAIASDWIAAYRKYIGPDPDNRPLDYQRHRPDHYRHWYN
ncbi:MAG: hypothetical protein JO122_07495 [Acetobacteraceae bacterium]|nr:hypothetical protein [Acetobacteraceae bacterium]